ncbi:MAG: mechanosensitive ion channel [Deltaproteobacteria bacterium]|jgi:small-conductance mechanosensitive channel|nr:mechanosensitive ion channel [Deltaproteobacteria bacterium]
MLKSVVAAGLLFFSLVASPLWAQQAPADPPTPDQPEAQPEVQQAVRQLWQDRTGDLQRLADEAQSAIAAAKLDGQAFNEKLKKTEAEVNRLLRLYQISRGRPSEQEDILRQLRGLAAQLSDGLRPLETALSAFGRQLAEVEAVRKSMADQDGDDALTTDYRRNLELAVSKLKAADHGLEIILEPGQESNRRLKQLIADIDAEVPQAWRDYFFDLPVGGLAASAQELGKWFKGLPSRTLFMYPQTGDAWSYFGLRFLIVAAALLLIGSLTLRGESRIPAAVRRDMVRIVKGPWIWMTLGLALLIGSLTSLGGSWLALKLPGVLMLIHGLGALSWRLRIAAKPELEGRPSPLDRFYKPAALGTALLFVDAPAGALTVVWLAAMAWLLAFLKKLAKQAGERGEKRLLPERAAYGGASWFAFGSLAVALTGHARLAVLVFMALYALVNIIILGSALVMLTAGLCRLIFDPERHPVKHAVIHSLALPVSFILSTISALPWLAAVPGSSRLIGNFLRRGYTVGDASFEFSRLVLIAALFLLFRSLRGLGATSLAHLPDSLPNIERGVIPPLQTLMTYLLWTVFALVSLSLLGVNFTSLAVVAGGLSVGIGFGLQNVCNNLVSGFMLIFGRSILVGDYVEIGGVAGTVKSVNMRCAVVETVENALVFVPNSTIMSGQFVNWTRNNRLSRRKIEFRAVYGTDVELVFALLRQAAEAEELAVKNPPPAVAVIDLSETSVVFGLWVTIGVDTATAAMSNIREAVYALFSQNGVKFYTRNVELDVSQATVAVRA